MIIPGMQKPHCTAPWSRNASCIGASRPSAASPSMVTSPAIRLDGQHQARVDRPAVDEHGAGAALAFRAALLGPRELHLIAQHREQRVVRLHIQGDGLSVDSQRNGNGHLSDSSPMRRRSRRPGPIRSGGASVASLCPARPRRSSATHGDEHAQHRQAVVAARAHVRDRAGTSDEAVEGCVGQAAIAAGARRRARRHRLMTQRRRRDRAERDSRSRRSSLIRQDTVNDARSTPRRRVRRVNAAPVRPSESADRSI